MLRKKGKLIEKILFGIPLIIVSVFIVIIIIGPLSKEPIKQNGKHPSLNSMAEIPAGVFLYGENKTEKNIDKSYFIDVYLVTNSQYRKFIKAEGYQNNDYWSEVGKKWKQDKQISKPRFWEDLKWNKSDHPVVGVSYYEAEAYAKWTGKRLPTEEEWERAARGTDGRKYPWGNDFDKERCNSEESGIEGTTRVTSYPNGKSPTGCYDMAGNVMEWTESLYNYEESDKVLRGCSWGCNRYLVRCAMRFGFFPRAERIMLVFVAPRQKNNYPLFFYTFTLSHIRN